MGHDNLGAELSPRAKTLRLQEVWAGPLFLGHCIGSAAQARRAGRKHYGAKVVRTVKLMEVDRETREEV